MSMKNIWSSILCIGGTPRHVITIHREYASDCDAQISSKEFMIRKSSYDKTWSLVCNGLVHSVHLLVVKLLAYTVLVVPKFNSAQGSSSGFRLVE